MFKIFSSKPKEFNIDWRLISVDFHSHLIPKVDDGVKTIEETIKILNHFKSLGYSTIYTSPHIMGEHFTNTKSDLNTAFEDLKKHPEIENIGIQFHLIAEYLLDEKFEKLLIQNEFLTIKNKYIIVETSMNYDFPFVREYIFELMKKGYQPILAHPERYHYIHNERNYIAKYEELLEVGVLFQLNQFSLIGLYGDLVKKIAEVLANRGFYTFVSSDIHSPNQLIFFNELKKSTSFYNLINSGLIKNKELI